MAYLNLTIRSQGGVYVVEHRNGKFLQFTADSLNNPWLIPRLKWFDKYGTMKGY